MSSEIRPLAMRNTVFTSNLVQGPLAGYTCAPFRKQTWRYSQPGYCSTEMISAGHLVHVKEQPRRYTYRDPIEGPLCYQLSASCPDIAAKATAMVDKMDVDIIELNCGCPVNKIRAKGAGSKLLSSPDQLARLVAAMRANTDKILSIKIRVAGVENDINNYHAARAIENAGADMLVVHGRHWKERYDVDCHYQQIAEIVNAVTIPVIGNGDVKDLTSLMTLMKTGCAGAMIARACVGQPWLFEQLEQQAQGNSYTLPSRQQIGAIFIDHIQELAQLDNPIRAVLQARKMGKYYARDHIDNKPDFLNRLMVCVDLDVFIALVQEYF